MHCSEWLPTQAQPLLAVSDRNHQEYRHNSTQFHCYWNASVSHSLKLVSKSCKLIWYDTKIISKTKRSVAFFSVIVINYPNPVWPNLTCSALTSAGSLYIDRCACQCGVFQTEWAGAMSSGRARGLESGCNLSSPRNLFSLYLTIFSFSF